MGETTLETEDRLIASALRCFSRSGYTGTSIREIIEDAGVTRPVLYYYFENKEALFCRLVQSEFDRFHAAAERILAENDRARDRLKALTAYSFTRSEEAREWVKLLIQFFLGADEAVTQLRKEDLAQQRFAQIARIMTDGIASGELRGSDPLLLAKAYASCIDLHIIARSHGDPAELSPALAEQLVDLFLDGAAHPARAPVQAELPLE